MDNQMTKWRSNIKNRVWERCRNREYNRRKVGIMLATQYIKCNHTLRKNIKQVATETKPGIWQMEDGSIVYQLEDRILTDVKKEFLAYQNVKKRKPAKAKKSRFKNGVKNE